MPVERGADAKVVRAAVALYGALARRLPRELYRDYGADMVADFRAHARRAYEDGGTPRVMRSLASACADVARGGVGEWWVERFERRGATVRGLRAERTTLGQAMMNWLQEFRIAARSLAQRPGFTLTVIATLALGIGATVAIFTVVNATLIRPLPFPDSERIVWIRHHAPAIQLPQLENSPGTLQLYEEHATSFSAIAAVREGQRNLAGGMEPVRIAVLQATPSLHDVLQVRPVLGRPFVDADADEGAAPVAILTHAAWQAHFGGAPDAVGRTVRLNDVTTEIVGVMPERFAYPNRETALLLPFRPDRREGFGSFGTGGMARLRPGVTLAAAQVEVSALQRRIPELFPDDVPQSFLDDVGWGATVATLRDTMVAGARNALWIVLGTVAFLLLVACASVANLFLVRAESRQREVGIRMALGAARARIAATYLYESVLVGIAGGLWGTVAALVAVRALVAAGPPQLPRLHEISMDGAVLGLAAVVSVGAGVLFGVLPLARRMTQPLGGILGSGRGQTAGRDRQRVRQALIVTQIALALVLLTGSGLMLRSFQHLRSLDPGFDADGVLTVGVSIGTHRTRDEAMLLTHRILEEVRAIPGVVSAGATNALPLDPAAGTNGGSFAIESRPRPDDALPPVAMYAVVTDGLHETLRTRLLEGRTIERADDEHGRLVAVVNETFARSYLDGRAIGERIRFGGADTTAWHEIVGVVADVRAFGLREEPRAMAYLPIMTATSGARPTLMSMALRTQGDALALAPRVRDAIRRVNPDVPLTTARTMTDIVGAARADTSFTMVILSVAALAALLLGAVGLYGVIGYVVSQRTKEIGVRIALGAVPGGVRRMVLRQGLALAAAGTAIGLAGAMFMSRLLDAVLFEVDSRDPLTFVGVAAVLFAVTALAAYLPARRASRISPLEALRAE